MRDLMVDDLDMVQGVRSAQNRIKEVTEYLSSAVE